MNLEPGLYIYIVEDRKEMSDIRLSHEEGVEEGILEKTAPPPQYKVFLLNDDYTTMEFVVKILESIFHKSSAEATQIMLHVHKKGAGLCGVYTKEIAETKAVMVHDLAKKSNYPLKCMLERE